MYKVQIFTSRSSEQLQTELNNFLEQLPESSWVENISQSVSDKGLCLTVLYTVEDREEPDSNSEENK